MASHGAKRGLQRRIGGKIIADAPEVGIPYSGATIFTDVRPAALSFGAQLIDNPVCIVSRFILCAPDVIDVDTQELLAPAMNLTI